MSTARSRAARAAEDLSVQGHAGRPASVAKVALRSSRSPKTSLKPLQHFSMPMSSAHLRLDADATATILRTYRRSNLLVLASRFGTKLSRASTSSAACQASDVGSPDALPMQRRVSLRSLCVSRLCLTSFHRQRRRAQSSNVARRNALNPRAVCICTVSEQHAVCAATGR